MKKITACAAFFFLVQLSYSQGLTASARGQLARKEDSLKTIALTILQGRNAEERFSADSLFTRMLVRALQVPHSFQYPFDSLISISKITPPDSSFRIFTWQLPVTDEVVRKHGAIQMRTADGSLKLFPLIDKTNVIRNIDDTITSNKAWIGALYYKIIEKKYAGNTYYTLLGYDDYTLSSNRKIIEPLSFENGEPVFGAKVFGYKPPHQYAARYIMEYKKETSPRLTYDKDMDMIVYEHLVSETGEPQKKYTYIPDGDYEGLKWQRGKWAYIEKVFTQVTPQGKEPVPAPIRDAKGNIDESRLSQRLPERDSTQNN